MIESLVKDIIRPAVQSIAPAGVGLPVDAILTEGDAGELVLETEGGFAIIKEGT